MTEPAPIILFRSGDALVTELGSTIRFEPRPYTEAGLGLGAVVLGLVFRVGSRGWSSWAAWVLWLCGWLLVVVGLTRAITPPWELSSELRHWKRGARRISFDEVHGVNVTVTRVGRVTAVALRLDWTHGHIWLVRGQPASRRAELQHVAERVRAMDRGPG